MRRSLGFSMLLGILFAVLPSVPAAGVDGSCDGSFPTRLECWSGRLDHGTATVTVDRPVPLDGSAKDRKAAVRETVMHRSGLEVLVPTGVSTGEGGTVLLVLAGHRVVDPDAAVDRLSQGTVTELEHAGACSPAYRDLCDVVGPAAGEPAQVPGHQLITSELVTGRSVYAVTPADRGTGAKTWLLYGMSALLALLLAVLVLVLRRSRAPRPAPAASGNALQQMATGPAHAPGHDRHDPGHDSRDPALAPDHHPRHDPGHEPTLAPGHDPTAEPITRPTTTPAAAQSRRPVSRKDRVRSVRPTHPTRPAVVRTDLHPQGYVELDRVLYRAVWARPGQAPPGPGARVDVTDAPERDGDVLHAFPPGTGRQTHAR